MIDKVEYQFASIARELGSSLILGAEDNVKEAQDLLERVRGLVADIQARVEGHTKMLNDASARTKVYGERVLAAHREYIDGGREETTAVRGPDTHDGAGAVRRPSAVTNPAANLWPTGFVSEQGK